MTKPCKGVYLVSLIALFSALIVGYYGILIALKPLRKLRRSMPEAQAPGAAFDQ